MGWTCTLIKRVDKKFQNRVEGFWRTCGGLKPDWRTWRTKYLIGGRPPHWRTLVSYDHGADHHIAILLGHVYSLKIDLAFYKYQVKQLLT